MENSFKIGMLVESKPRFDLGTRQRGPNIVTEFQGVGMIIDLEWPSKARILTNKGDQLWVQTSSIVQVSNVE